MNWDDEDRLWRPFESMPAVHPMPEAREHLGGAVVQQPIEPGPPAPEESALPDHDGRLLASGALRARLDRIEHSLVTLTHAIEAMQPAQVAGGQESPDVAGLTDVLATLEKQISRAGREQFKASTLAEAQRDQLHTVLEALRAIELQRKEEVEAIREGLVTAVGQARLEVAQAVLPALDGLDEALRSGRRLADAPPVATASPRRSWFRRGAPPLPSGQRPQADLQAWLVGLEFVRERLLGVLEAEGITAIPAQGLPFDPQIHLAVEISQPGPDTPAGSIAAVIRQGYQLGGRVVRPAEVAVARAE